MRDLGAKLHALRVTNTWTSAKLRRQMRTHPDDQPNFRCPSQRKRNHALMVSDQDRGELRTEP